MKKKKKKTRTLYVKTINSEYNFPHSLFKMRVLFRIVLLACIPHLTIKFRIFIIYVFSNIFKHSSVIFSSILSSSEQNLKCGNIWGKVFLAFGTRKIICLLTEIRKGIRLRISIIYLYVFYKMYTARIKY